MTRRSTNKKLIPARVGRNGPYHLEGSPCFPFLPGLCPGTTKQTAFRYRKCLLACAGAPCTDFPFICLQSIFLSGLKKSLEILHKTQQRGKGSTFQPAWRKKTDDVHISSRLHVLCLGGYQQGKAGLLLKVEGFHKVLLRVNWATPALK